MVQNIIIRCIEQSRLTRPHNSEGGIHTNNNDRFADTLRTLRRDRGYTAAELAERAGLDRAQLMEWECGESMPTPEEFMRLVTALGVTADRLMSGDDVNIPAVVRTANNDIDKAGSRPRADIINISDTAAEMMPQTEDINAEGFDTGDANAAARSALDGAGQLAENLRRDMEARIGSKIRDAVKGAFEGLEGRHDQDDGDSKGRGSDETGEDADAGAGETDDGMLKRISALAPFMSSEALSKLAFKALQRGEAADVKLIEQLAPFLDSDALEALLTGADINPNWGMVERLAPFLSEEALDKLALSCVGSGGIEWNRLMKLTPFLSEATLSKLVDMCAEGESADWNRIAELAPFLDEETLTRLVQRCRLDGEPDWARIQKLAPFLPEAALDEIVLKYMDSRWGK